MKNKFLLTELLLKSGDLKDRPNTKKVVNFSFVVLCLCSCAIISLVMPIMILGFHSFL